MIRKQIVLGTEGIRSLQAYFQSIQDNLDATMKKAERHIAEYGAEQLKDVAPMMSVDGNQPGSVFLADSDGMMHVVYAGEDVAYIEFGTGYIGENNPYPDEIVLNGVGWDYDVNDHGYKGWVYRKKDGGGFRHSRGMKPEAPVLKAFIKTRLAVPQLVKEVMDEEFGK